MIKSQLFFHQNLLLLNNMVSLTCQSLPTECLELKTDLAHWTSGQDAPLLSSHCDYTIGFGLQIAFLKSCQGELEALQGQTISPASQLGMLLEGILRFVSQVPELVALMLQGHITSH